MFYCRRWISLAGPSFAFFLIVAPWLGVICHANLPQLATPQRNATQFPSAVMDRAYLNSVHAEGRDIIGHGEILAIQAFIHTRMHIRICPLFVRCDEKCQMPNLDPTAKLWQWNKNIRTLCAADISFQRCHPLHPSKKDERDMETVRKRKK